MFHRHKFSAVDVYHEPVSDDAGKATDDAATIILWRCHCEAVKAQTISGKWTLGQIQGAPDEPTEREG